MIAMRHISQLFKTYVIKERRHDCNIKPLPKYKRGGAIPVRYNFP